MCLCSVESAGEGASVGRRTRLVQDGQSPPHPHRIGKTNAAVGAEIGARDPLRIIPVRHHILPYRGRQKFTIELFPFLEYNVLGGNFRQRSGGL